MFRRSLLTSFLAIFHSSKSVNKKCPTSCPMNKVVITLEIPSFNSGKIKILSFKFADAVVVFLNSTTIFSSANYLANKLFDSIIKFLSHFLRYELLYLNIPKSQALFRCRFLLMNYYLS